MELILIFHRPQIQETTYSWPTPTFSNTGIVGTSSETGVSIISQTLINNSNENSTISYIITPTTASCTGSIVQVGAVETRFNKNGTIEKERMIDKFFIGKDGLVHTMRQWNADW